MKKTMVVATAAPTQGTPMPPACLGAPRAQWSEQLPSVIVVGIPVDFNSTGVSASGASP
ncbi:MAG TPA: hypothetical protein VD813_09050 [Pseudonocardia sp.]|nr:hypothetical protein [Pseudonocardia sp.]